MNKFYFNTGVRPTTIRNPPFPYEYHKEQGHIIKDGALLIPFECDAPKDAKLLYLCDIPNLPESKQEDVIVVEVFNTTMLSKYAYFKKV